MAQDDGRDAAIALLSRPREYDRAIQKTKDAIRDTRLALTSISVSYSDMPRGGGGPHSRTEEGVVAIVALEEKLRRLEDERAKVAGEVAGVISRLDDPQEQEVLIMLFLKGESWEVVANHMECSTKTVGACRRNGIDKLSQVIEETNG